MRNYRALHCKFPKHRNRESTPIIRDAFARNREHGFTTVDARGSADQSVLPVTYAINPRQAEGRA